MPSPGATASAPTAAPAAAPVLAIIATGNCRKWEGSDLGHEQAYEVYARYVYLYLYIVYLYRSMIFIYVVYIYIYIVECDEHRPTKIPGGHKAPSTCHDWLYV